MTWEIVSSLIAQYGIPLAEKLVQKWTSADPVTLADFAALRALAATTAEDKMKQSLAAAGIPLDDPHAVALLALTKS